MNKHFLLTFTGINSMLILFAKPISIIAKPIDDKNLIRITNSSNINTATLTYNKVQIDHNAQDILAKHKAPEESKDKQNTNKADKTNTNNDDSQQTATKPKVEQLNNGNNTDDDNAHYQKGIPKMFKVTFYDPKVLGASTMPGGLYAGVAADLNVFPKGTRLKITLPDGTVLKRIVNDTGTFAYTNHYQLDIAYPNSSIPSYGTTMAKVEVLN